MGSKGRIPPPRLRHPHPGPGMGSHPHPHPDPFGPPPVRPPPGAYPPYDMLPPPEVMEQKLATQHVEMQRLMTENHRLAATHGALRQELAASQHELQLLNAQIGAVKSDADQQIRGLTEKIAKTEADLKAAEPLKLDLQKAHTEAQKLIVSRQELISKVQVLSTDLQRAHVDVQQIPALMSELDGLRQEYQHCRATYDYEKKLYNDHLESLQVMEKNYMNMAREVEKLRGELMNPAYADRRPVAPYGEHEASGYPASQNANEDGYGAHQGRAPPPPATGSAVPSAPVAPVASAYAGAQSGPGPTAYDPVHGHGGYDPQFQRGVPNYDPQRAGYDPQRAQGYETQRGGPGYDPSRAGGGYDAQSRGAAAGPHGHVTPTSHMPYGSATPPQPAHPGNNNPARR